MSTGLCADNTKVSLRVSEFCVCEGETASVCVFERDQVRRRKSARVKICQHWFVCVLVFVSVKDIICGYSVLTLQTFGLHCARTNILMFCFEVLRCASLE